MAKLERNIGYKPRSVFITRFLFFPDKTIEISFREILRLTIRAPREINLSVSFDDKTENVLESQRSC